MTSHEGPWGPGQPRQVLAGFSSSSSWPRASAPLRARAIGRLARRSRHMWVPPMPVGTFAKSDTRFPEWPAPAARRSRCGYGACLVAARKNSRNSCIIGSYSVDDPAGPRCSFPPPAVGATIARLEARRPLLEASRESRASRDGLSGIVYHGAVTSGVTFARRFFGLRRGPSRGGNRGGAPGRWRPRDPRRL